MLLFENISFSIGEGERVGLIARNGAGKSTLLSILSSGEDYDAGTISFAKDLRVAHLVQEPTFSESLSVIEACFSGDAPALRVISEYESALLGGDAGRIERAIEKMDECEAWDYEQKIKQILSQLKITDFDQPISQLSGGQIKRVALANALINEPQLLILDEPTNHLDLDVTRWLEEWLSHSRIALLMVTHDRYFLDRVCNRILEIDQRQIFAYRGNYSHYLEKRNERLASAAQQRESDMNLYRKEIDWMRRQPQARATKAKARIEGFYQLEDRLRREREQGKVKIEAKNTYIGKKIFEVKNLAKSYGDKCLLRGFSYLFARGEKMGIVGENGVGKSTFIKMLMGEVAPDSGSVDIGQTVRFGYYSQGGIEFDSSTKVIDVVSNIAEYVDMGDGRRLTASQLLQHFLFEPKRQQNFVGRLSGGEKRRLYLCTILMTSPNFLILDEPTNDLDIMTLQVLEEYLASFAGCVMVVSHDRYFMDKVADHLLVFEGEGRIKDFPSSYSDFLVWRDVRAEELAAPKEKKVVAAPQTKAPSTKLSYKERQEFESLEAQLAELGAERAELEQRLSSGALSSEALISASNRVGAVIDLIDEMEMRWLELSERA